MKKITLLGLLLFGFIMEAQVISHSTSLTLGTTNIACNSGTSPNTTSSDNQYFRFFNLSSFSITGNYTTSNVQFGIQSLNNPSLPGGFPVTVNLYTTTGSSFPSGYPTGYTLLVTATVNILPADVGTLVSVPIVGTVPAGQNLLVEVSYAAAAAASLNRVFLSANDLGQTAPSYLASTGCGITAPTNLANIGSGFPNAHFILSVTGAVLSVDSNLLDKQVSIYPNPSKGVFSISLPSNVLIEKATLNDVSGKQMDIKINSENTFDITAFNSGIYFLKVVTNEGTITKKIIKD